jgi:hypothetical protein
MRTAVCVLEQVVGLASVERCDFAATELPSLTDNAPERKLATEGTMETDPRLLARQLRVQR